MARLFALLVLAFAALAAAAMPDQRPLTQPPAEAAAALTPTTAFVCETEGFAPNPDDCRKYYYCKRVKNVGIVPYPKTCQTVRPPLALLVERRRVLTIATAQSLAWCQGISQCGLPFNCPGGMCPEDNDGGDVRARSQWD